MLKEHSSQLHGLLQTADVTLAAVMFAAVLGLPGMNTSAGPGFPMSLAALALASAVTWPVAFQRLGLYASQRLERLRAVLAQMAVAGVLATIAHYAAAFVLSAPVSPAFPLVCGLGQLAALSALRIAVLMTLRFLRRSGRNTRNVLIVGTGPRAAYVKQQIETNPSWGLTVLAFIDKGEPPGGPRIESGAVFALEHMAEILQDQVVDEVIVACPRSMLTDIVGVVDACALAGVPITLLSDLFGDYLPAPRSTRFGSLPALSFAAVHHSRSKLLLKRTIDVVGAAGLLLLASPVLLAAAIAIKLTSRGPVFFRQVRCGLNGRQFVMHKLRTMYVDAESRRFDLQARNEMDGPVFKMRDDPRVTPVGRFLRRYSIDELPQIWDVLTGHMSLVGPRPSIPTEVAEYETFERRRLSMRPGLTCIWQVSGRNEIGFDDWVRLDLEYIDTWSLRNDFRILAMTLPAVLSGEGAS